MMTPRMMKEIAENTEALVGNISRWKERGYRWMTAWEKKERENKGTVSTLHFGGMVIAFPQ